MFSVTAVLVVPGCGGGDSEQTAGPVKASYYVYFFRRADAREAAAELRVEGFKTELREDEGIEWLVIATREVPRAELRIAESQMRYVAYRFQGDYDGSDVDD